MGECLKMMREDIGRVVLVGTGAVGTSFAYAMLNQGITEELVLIDINEKKAEGEAMDLNHGVPFASSSTKIWKGSYADCGYADVVVITAGAPQKPGETRLDLVEKNAKIFKSMIGEIMNSGFNGIFVIASNPVDILTYVTWKYSGLPKEQVIGSGTILDTGRFRYMLGNYFGIDSRNVHAYIMGEHGDTEFPVWSHAFIGTKSLAKYMDGHPSYKKSDLDDIFVNVRDAAYDIIERKGATHFGIGMGLTRLVKAILKDENSIQTVAAYLNGEYGHSDVYIGVPAIINRQGIREIIELELSAEEKEKMNHSVKVLKETMAPVL